MKVSKNWLQELVNLKISIKEVERLLPLRTISTREITDDFIELDMKGYNRADLLSTRGVAREVAAITGSEIKFKDETFPEYNLPKTPVEIADQELSSVQCVARIEGLKVESSSKEWLKKLADSGMRSVNNIADVTNLIMLEFGQPLHAFDESTVKDDTINVRLAKKGEEITTLDGKRRILEETDIVLADAEKALDVAGVMGGKDTEIKDSTTTILLSASLFNPRMVRKTAHRLGLHSEASKRFQHGLTKTNLFQALVTAIKMYEELGGKLTGLTIIGDTKDDVKTVQLTQGKINSLIGVDIPAKEVESSLQKLGFSLNSKGNSWEVTVPYWRLDINIEEDLIEEVARMYGYEKIPAKALGGELPEKLDQSLPNFIYDLKVALKNAGLIEVQTYSFYSTAVLNNLNYDKKDLVKIANPISSETEFLRNHLWPNLVEVVGKNLRNGFKDIAIFEVGKIYYPQKSDLPKEEYRLSIALLNGSEDPTKELNQIFKNVVQSLKLEIKLGEEIGESAGRFHPTRYIYLNFNNKPIGKIGEVHSRILNQLGIEKRVAILEINLEELV